jgi:hypothetical protein
MKEETSTVMEGGRDHTFETDDDDDGVEDDCRVVEEEEPMLCHTDPLDRPVVVLSLLLLKH